MTTIGAASARLPGSHPTRTLNNYELANRVGRKERKLDPPRFQDSHSNDATMFPKTVPHLQRLSIRKLCSFGTKKLLGSAMKTCDLLFMKHEPKGLLDVDAGRKLINKSQDHWISGKCSRLTSSTGGEISRLIVSRLLKAKQEGLEDLCSIRSIWFRIVCASCSHVNLPFKVDSIALRFR